MSAPGDRVREALARHAQATPEGPLVFFRSPRGTFTWWSCARVAAAFGAGGGDDPAAAVPAALLASWRDADDEAISRGAAVLALAGAGPARQVAISARPLECASELALTLAAALGGWALVREPGERLHPDLFLWARPTLVSGTAPELLALGGGALAAAPRFRRARWLQRRVARLAFALVEAPGPGELEAVSAAFSGLGAAPRVLPFPGGGW